MVEVGENLQYDFVVNNFSDSDRMFVIVSTDETPDEWNYHYSTEDGDFNSGDLSIISVPANSSHNCSVTFNTEDGEPFQQGSAFIEVFDSNLPSQRRCINFFGMTSGDVLVINDDINRDYDSHYLFPIEYSAEEMPEIQFSRAVWPGYSADFNFDDLNDMDIQFLIYNTSTRESIDEDQIEYLTSYLTGGGKLMLCGTHTSQMIGNELNSLMGAEYSGQISDPGDVNGMGGDLISDGLSFTLDGETSSNNWTTVAGLNAMNGAMSFKFADDGSGAGISYNTYTTRSLLLGFPFESIDTDDNRVTVMYRILRYMLDESVDVNGNVFSELPEKFELKQNYPNPFNPSTEIAFSLPERAQVQLSIYNVNGQEVARLMDKELQAGEYRASWSGADVSSGVYFYRISAEGSRSYSMTRKMLLVK
jgi:Secretion system C-terminal sorting domain